jgi:glycosyltransferase involved in cell wall biosynthesis
MPGVRPRVDQPRRQGGGPLRLLFVGTSFFGKGAVEAIEALRTVRESHDVELDIVTLVPPGWRERLDGVPGLRVHERISTPAVRALYADADALIFPAHVDTLGWVVFEAMAEALPIVACDHYALPEMVEDGVSGLLFPHENSLYGSDGLPRFKWLNPTSLPESFLAQLQSPSPGYVEAIAARLARLADDRELLERLSAGALERVTTGPLSMERRRTALGSAYSVALAG